MNQPLVRSLLLVIAVTAGASLPLVAVAETPAQLAANKKLVVGFWNAVFVAQDASKIKDYVSPDFIQHNSTAPPGRDGLMDVLSKRWPKPKPAGTVVPAKFTAVMAESDLVQIVEMRPRPLPDDAAKTYESFWFGLYRVKGGKIVEHWDSDRK